MTLRILLLILMIALFVGIWSNDRPAAQRLEGDAQLAASQSQPNGSARRVGQVPADAVTQITPIAVMPIGSELAAASPQQATVKPTAVLPLRATDVPLPDDLPAGEYRVVSSDGRVWTLTVPPIASSHESRPMPELYTLTADGARCYFIRLEKATSDVSAPTQYAAPLTALLLEWNDPSLVGEVLARCRCDFGMLCDGSCRWCDKTRRRLEARLRQAEVWMASLWTLVQRRLAAAGEATTLE